MKKRIEKLQQFVSQQELPGHMYIVGIIISGNALDELERTTYQKRK